MSETAQKSSETMLKNLVLAGTVFNSMLQLVAEPTQKYELSYLRACRNLDISWDGLQFLCISLCRSLLKSMSYPISDHADKLILAEKVFHFYALTSSGAYYKVSVIPSQFMQKNLYWLRQSSISMHELVPETTQKHRLSHLIPCIHIDTSWDHLQFLCISLCRSLLKSLNSPLSDAAEKLILTHTVSNLYALACAGAYSKVWLIPSQSMQNNWY